MFRNRKTFLFLFTLCLPILSAKAAEDWIIEPVKTGSWPDAIIEEKGRAAPDGLPDGRIATSTVGDIAQAWYGEPTSRYAHAILGDGIEAGTLHVKTRAGETHVLRLPQTEVFEDRMPRLADLDGDGTTEIITIRASTSKGGSVTVYGLVNGNLRQLATNGFIGRANRWLNIAGIADFDGRPGLEIAFVRTPHIGGTLFYYTYRNGMLRRIAAMDGFSNHEIGAREMRLSAITDVDADGRIELALPSNNRATLRIIELGSGGLMERAAIALPARINRAIAVQGKGDKTAIFVGMDNGQIVRIGRD